MTRRTPVGQQDRVNADIVTISPSKFDQPTRNGSPLSAHLSKKWANKQDGNLASRKSLVTFEQGDAVRGMLTAQESAEVDTRMLSQFLRATKQDPEKAAKRLKDTLAWRDREQPHRKVCQRCTSLPRAHYLHVVGFSKLDQPMIYSCMAMAKDRDVLANREHMLVTFEQAIRAMPAHVEQWIWLCDFHGFGLRDCDPRLAKMFLDISERHYPERLAEFIVISPPSVFNMLWKAIEPWVDTHTRSKVKFVHFDSKKASKKNDPIRKELDRLAEPEVVDWVIDEMAANRQKKVVKEKEYPYGKLHKAVPAGSGVILDGHDARGTSDWIRAVEENPDILMPNNAQ